MKGSLIIVACFALGVLVGYLHWVPDSWLTGNLSFIALCALMCCVGLSMGSDPQALAGFRKLNIRLALLPLMTIGGTLAGSVAIALLLPQRTVPECCAVGSGLGYYSLSSIIITEYKSAELGTIALLCNIGREVITLLCAPLLARWFGPLAPIAAGGATSMDTTLPIITRCCGQELAMVSIYHGCVADFSVTFLVTLFCTL